MKKTKTNRSLVIAAVAVLAIVSIIVYCVLRTLFVFRVQYSLLEKIMGFTLLISEMYILLHALGYFTGIYRLYTRTTAEPGRVELKQFPSVAILIPARHEPKDILESTILGCYNQSYPSKTIYILDDSSEQKYKDEAEELTKKYNCRLFRRETRHGAKAGVINDCLKSVTADYIAVFDVDQNPIDGFLNETVSILEADPKLAFVQTPQYYSNLQSNKISMAADMQQAVFYEHICEAKSARDAMMCCGTNVVFRRRALESIGGFDESCVTEDFATSLLLHLKGWKTLYYNHVCVFGRGPENLGAYLCQQSRWAMGSAAVLRKVVARLVCSPFSLHLWQWWEYLISSSYYLSSWGYLFLIFCPIIYIFFSVPSFFMNPVIYGLAFLPYLILSNTVFYSQMKSRHYKSRQIQEGQLLFFLALPTYMMATLSGLLGLKRGFKITAKGDMHKIPYIQLWVPLSLWAIHLVAITWGINRFIYDSSAAILVNIIWVTYHFAIFSSIFYFNEE